MVDGAIGSGVLEPRDEGRLVADDGALEGGVVPGDDRDVPQLVLDDGAAGEAL